MNNLSENVLYELEQLLEHGGIVTIHDRFIIDAQMLGGTFTDDSKTEFEFYEQDEHGDYLAMTNRYSEKLNQTFSNVFKHATQAISNKLARLVNNEERISELKMLLDNLAFFHKLANEKRSISQAELIRWWIKKFINYIRDKYKSSVSEHSAYKLLNDKLDDTYLEGYFGFKGKINELGTLYNKLIDLNIFSREETDLKVFKKIFSSPDPSNLDIALRFSCTQEEAAFVIDKIRSRFHNFGDSEIVSSKCFKTKQGQPLVLNNFQKARSEFKKDLTKEDRRNFLEESLKF
ncbi:MAG TPA: hypothetical protein VF622_07690 [Segetibacter sp.]|jgi:hypothetical protein